MSKLFPSIFYYFILSMNRYYNYIITNLMIIIVWALPVAKGKKYERNYLNDKSSFRP